MELYKKGMMQKLFSQEIRFKDEDGHDYPDWEEKRLGDVFDFVPTNSLSRDALTYSEGTVCNIHYGDIHTKFRSTFDLGHEYVPRIKEAKLPRNITENSYCVVGDVVFADASEDYADIGKCVEITKLDNRKLVAGLHTILARPKQTFALGFLAYMFQAYKVRKSIMVIAQGTKVLGLSKKYLSGIVLIIPGKEEQEKIAGLFTILDRNLETLCKKKSQLETFKKGLLQKMFV